MRHSEFLDLNYSHLTKKYSHLTRTSKNAQKNQLLLRKNFLLQLQCWTSHLTIFIMTLSDKKWSFGHNHCWRLLPLLKTKFLGNIVQFTYGNHHRICHNLLATWLNKWRLPKWLPTAPKIIIITPIGVTHKKKTYNCIVQCCGYRFKSAFSI